MRRLALVGAVVMLAGCKDAFSGHVDTVARVQGQELSVERMAAMLAPAKQVPLRREVLDRLAEMWVDYQALAAAVSRGDSLTDSATIAAATWPLIAQSLANHLHDSLVSAVRPTPAQVDSAYNAGDHRYIAHILVRVQGADTAAARKAAKRRLAEGYLAQLRHGADFATLASRVSEDPGSKANGGSLGLITRGQMVRVFEDIAFTLRPGQLSDVIESPFGFHIVYRPALAACRDSFTVALDDMLKARFDSLYLDSLTNRTRINVRSRAPQMVRNAAGALREARERTGTLATFEGGKLTERDFARWLQAFPPQTRGMVLQADDSTITEFVKSIARNEMLINDVRRRGIQLSRADWDSIQTRYRSDLSQMLAVLGLSADSLATDSAAHGPGRAAVAARRVDAYLAAITAHQGSRPYVEVPAFLGDVLRSRTEWSISEAGVNRAVDRAKTLRGPETPAPAGQPGGQLQPVPRGGPPLPPQGTRRQ